MDFHISERALHAPPDAIRRHWQNIAAAAVVAAALCIAAALFAAFYRPAMPSVGANGPSALALDHLTTQCSASTDCGGGLFCRQGACVECFADSQCAAANAVCGPDMTCTPRCNVHSDCAADATCINNTCVGCSPRAAAGEPGACTGSGTPFCDPSTLQCIECGGAHDCAAGEVCLSGACWPACDDKCPSPGNCVQGACTACDPKNTSYCTATGQHIVCRTAVDCVTAGLPFAGCAGTRPGGVCLRASAISGPSVMRIRHIDTGLPLLMTDDHQLSLAKNNGKAALLALTVPTGGVVWQQSGAAAIFEFSGRDAGLVATTLHGGAAGAGRLLVGADTPLVASGLLAVWAQKTPVAVAINGTEFLVPGAAGGTQATTTFSAVWELSAY